MSNEPHNLPDDVLERATGALRDMVIPDGPGNDLIEATLAQLPVDDRYRAPLTSSWRINPVRSLARLAVAAMILIAVALAAMWYSTPSLTWASVLGQINRERSVRFKTAMTIPGPGGKPQDIVLDTTVVEPERMRSVIAPGWVVTIWDFHQGRTLVLVPSMRQAILMEMQNLPVGKKPINILAELKETSSQAGTPLPGQEIGGIWAKGFKIARPNSDMTVWVDPQTQLPVRVEIEVHSNVLPASRMTITDFVWDPPVDESQFSLTPPSDYTVLPLVLNMAPVGEQDVIEMLRRMAELNGGRFAPGLDMASLGQVARRLEQSMPKDRQSAERKQFEDKMVGLSPVIGRAWAFINDPSMSTDWHYAGEGVDLGKGGVPILWYRPPISAKYRVIDADLSVHEVMQESLPRIPSVRLGPTTSPSRASYGSRPTTRRKSSTCISAVPRWEATCRRARCRPSTSRHPALTTLPSGRAGRAAVPFPPPWALSASCGTCSRTRKSASSSSPSCPTKAAPSASNRQSARSASTPPRARRCRPGSP